jgi:ubiquitin-activating enzyme E1
VTDDVLYRMSKLVEHISKKPIPGHQKNVIFEITAEDQTGEDVEVPYVMVRLEKYETVRLEKARLEKHT